jgi:hypothetical protein
MTAVHPVPRPLRGRRWAWIAAAPYPLWRAFSPPDLVARAAALLQSTSVWAALRSSEEAAVSASSNSHNSSGNSDHASAYTASSGGGSGSGSTTASNSPSPTHAGDGAEGMHATNNSNSTSNNSNSSSATTSPTQFSFWLAASLPLGDTTRHSLLAMDSVVQRLRACVEHLERAARLPLRCAACGLRIALQADVFSVPGAEGSVGAYVNSAGFVHQTITLRAARGLRLDTSAPSTADRCAIHVLYYVLYCLMFVDAIVVCAFSVMLA